MLNYAIVIVLFVLPPILTQISVAHILYSFDMGDY